MRPRDPQSTSLHVHPHNHTSHPEQVTSGGRLGLAAVQWGLQTQEAAEEGDSGHPTPSKAQVQPRDPPSLLAPSRVQRDHVYWPGGSGDDALPPQRPREAQLPKAKAASSRAEGPAEWSVPPAPLGAPPVPWQPAGAPACWEAGSQTDVRGQGTG